jgi:uncharacterized protein
MNFNNPIICKTILQQARGLMFRKKRNLVMIFNQPRRISLHMFFVFYPIDIFLLNKDKEIIEIKRNFKPFTFYCAKNKASYLLETPELNKTYKVGDKIIIDEKN